MTDVPTYAQLQAEPYWNNETVPATLDTLQDRLCARYGVPRYHAGAKGDNNHLYGRHRSIEWSLNSAYCTDRSYGTVDGRDRRGNWRHIRAFDLTLPFAQLGPMCRRLDAAVRAGRAPQVAEWFGTFDGNTVVGWFESRESSSDDTHLWHLHLGLWTENADDDHTGLYEILTGEEMLTAEEHAWLRRIHQRSYALNQLLESLDLHGGEGVEQQPVAVALKGLVARPPVQSAPVDPATLAAALADPAFLTPLAKAVADELHRRTAD